MVDSSYESEEQWAPLQGFDGLPIPGLAPSEQPGRAPAPPQLTAGTQMQPRFGDAPAPPQPTGYTVNPSVLSGVGLGFGDDGGASPAPAAPAAPENSHSLGLALLLLSVGTGVGIKYGGAMGGVAGGLYAGATVNAIRAARCVTLGNPDSDKEAMRSGTWAMLGAALATYLVVRENKGAKKPEPAAAHRNASDDEDASDDTAADAEGGDDE